jgi:hypothetical protein
MAEVPEEVKRLLEAIDAFEAMEDPAARTSAVSQALRDWPGYHARLRQVREASVRALREEQQKTWPEIANIIGDVSAERARQIGTGVTTAQKVKAKKQANAAKKAAEE